MGDTADDPSKAAVNVPDDFLDNPNLLFRAKHKKAVKVEAQRKDTPSGRREKVKFAARKVLHFLDFPAEIRELIYDYLFKGAVIKRTKKKRYRNSPHISREIT